IDTLSITASVIAVATLAAKTGSASAHLRSVHKTLPRRLHELNNEVADLKSVSIVGSEHNSAASHIEHLLSQANSKLSEIKAIVDHISTTTTTLRSRSPASALLVWKQEQGRLQGLQEDIKTVRCTLNIMLGASQS
ncbi:hypothetical protein DL98DRAFT_432533, partial [Cadophora sp. DSE1049]